MMLKALWAMLPQKLQELVSYGFFGVLTTAVNYVVYLAATRSLQLDYRIANIAAWAVAVSFAFFTNKIWVFRSRIWHPRVLSREMAAFFAGRLLSGVMDNAGLTILVSGFGMNDLIGKAIVSVLVIVLNYVLSKLFVFSRSR